MERVVVAQAQKEFPKIVPKKGWSRGNTKEFSRKKTKEGINELISQKISSGEKRAHIYFNSGIAPDSTLYFNKKDKFWREKLSCLDRAIRWIVVWMVETGREVIISNKRFCPECTGLPSNPCDRCCGKELTEISLERSDWISHGFIEVRL